MSEEIQRKLRTMGKGNVAQAQIEKIRFSVENNGRGLEAFRFGVKIRMTQLPKINDTEWRFYQYE